ncbi:MAG TPA: multicopper oxidase domain-containing protein [Gemmatimonadales bacterium]|nr:multicopper oxidase domain-containing protein [Gemmatimonadales bacterium]
MLAPLRLAPFCALALGAASFSRTSPPMRVTINDNRIPAGTLQNGVLTIELELREGEWHPDRDADPGLVLHAFAEVGKPPAIPGPLIRVPEGTVIHATLHNALGDSAVFIHGFSQRGIAGSPNDPLRLEPGQSHPVSFTAGNPGTYYYWASTRAGPITDRSPSDAELAGAFIIDPAGTAAPPRERVLVLAEWNRDGRAGGIILRTDLTRFTINGKAWPNTERLTYTVGDTLRFRVINASDNPHPMHLHGFYYRVESRGDGSRDTRYDPAAPPQLVVTERVAPGRSFSMAWVPERAGYWLFHCHNNFHVLRGRPLDGSPLVPEYRLHPENHALELMGGLVMGIEVRPGGAPLATEPVARRRLRLIARVDSAAGGSEAEPAYRYVLEEGGRGSAAGPSLPGPLILLKRGEPVSITVVNQLPEATAVHWHGIELDSYMDGVAGYSGHPGRIAPAIAPRDSFEARFTPPRAGSFIYHPHADEVRQQQAGLSGPLLVVNDPAPFDPVHDIVLLLSTPRREADADHVLLNGSLAPAPLELRRGERYRFRVIDIHTFRPSMIVRLVRDSTPLTWRAIAKDGMELPAGRAVVGPAVQQMGNGETYDFEFAPGEAGEFRITVSAAAGDLLVAMPVRVR